jgi:hypothetical protein
VEAEQLHRGMVLCHPGFPLRAVRVFLARIVALELKIPILQGAQVPCYAPLPPLPLCYPGVETAAARPQGEQKTTGSTTQASDGQTSGGWGDIG